MEKQSDLYDFAEAVLSRSIQKKKTGFCRCCGCPVLPKYQYCDNCMEEKVPRLETWGPDTY